MGDETKGQPQKIIENVCISDVMLGRGTGTNENPGNKRYRSLVKQRKEEYTNTNLRSEKNKIAQWVYDEVVGANGRFIKPVGGGGGGTIVYVEVETEVALEKIRQSLRQNTERPRNRPSISSPSSSKADIGPPEIEQKVVNVGGSPTFTAPLSTKVTNPKQPSTATALSTQATSPKHSSTATALFPQVTSPKQPSTARPLFTPVAIPTEPSTAIPPKIKREEQSQKSELAQSKDLQRYKLILSYDGSRYKGWQRQSSDNRTDTSSRTDVRHFKKRKYDEIGRVVTIPLTIQESLEDALEYYTNLDRATLRVRMAGRTDSGVHAKGQVVVVSLPIPGNGSNPSKDTELWQIRKSINSRLPRDISVDKVSLCDDIFDPRHDVVSKQYSYTIRYREKHIDSNGKPLALCEKGGPELLRTAFDNYRCWLVPWTLNTGQLQRYCELLVGNYDYSAFVHRKSRDDRDNHKNVTRLDYQVLHEYPDDDEDSQVVEMRFFIEAKGFGRSQVRNMIGFLVDLCRGAIKDHETITEWLWNEPTDELSKRINAAPACGLCLEWVKYGEGH